MSTKKTLQRKKPGFTKAGVAKIVSQGTKQLVEMLERTQKNKIKAKIQRRLNHFGYVAPVVEEVVVEEVAE
jgi:SOS response regulatory protein OraA/RecX